MWAIVADTAIVYTLHPAIAAQIPPSGQVMILYIIISTWNQDPRVISWMKSALI
jgi:hypothetical protein